MESDVIKWGVISGCCGQDPDGEFVLVDDYDALRTELDETKAGHQRVMDALKDSNTVHVNILRGEIVLSDVALLHIAKTRGIDGETLRRERDELVKALESLSNHYEQYSMDRTERSLWRTAYELIERIKGDQP